MMRSNIGVQIPFLDKPERFLKFIKVQQGDDACWEWSGSILKSGYGCFGIVTDGEPRTYRAHRVSFSIFIGPLIPELLIDHRCRNRKCVNPDHLRQVTVLVNIFENSLSNQYLNSIKTECSRGHELTEKNVRLYNGHRGCRACEKLSGAAQRQKNRDKRKTI